MSPVSAADVAEVCRLSDSLPDNAADDLAALENTTEVLGFVVAQARAEGHDEADSVELVVRAAEVSKDDLRASERVLRPLGYIAVADRLRHLARSKRRFASPA